MDHKKNLQGCVKKLNMSLSKENKQNEEKKMQENGFFPSFLLSFTQWWVLLEVWVHLKFEFLFSFKIGILGFSLIIENFGFYPKRQEVLDFS